MAKPRVGLLSIGTEEGKGTELTSHAHELLKTLGDCIDYRGLIEGFQIFEDVVDVVVTDGFTGNVMLKSCESLWRMMKVLVRDQIRGNVWRMLGALMLKGCFGQMKAQLDPKQYGGAPLLGLRGTVLKAHGSSNRDAIASAIRIASAAVAHDLNKHSVSAIAHANERIRQALPSESIDVYT
jgi:glycerol-3-phosphate acyltransferase PlsX